MSDAVDDATARSPSSHDTTLEAATGSWLRRFPALLNATILATILTIAGTILGTFVQSYESLQLERAKEQHDLVLKMISVGDLKLAKENLQFLAESGLIADHELANKILTAKANPVLPQSLVNSNVGKPDGMPCGVGHAGHTVNGFCQY